MNVEFFVTMPTSFLENVFVAFSANEMRTAFIQPFLIATVFAKRMTARGLEHPKFIDYANRQNLELLFDQSNFGNFNSLSQELG